MVSIKLIAGLVVAAALAGGVYYVDSILKDNARLTLENDRLADRLEEQNAAITKLETESQARLEAAQAAIVQAQRETAAARRRAQDLFRAKPSTPSDLCQSALDLINGEAK